MGKSPCLIGKSTINGHFQFLCSITRGHPSWLVLLSSTICLIHSRGSSGALQSLSLWLSFLSLATLDPVSYTLLWNTQARTVFNIKGNSFRKQLETRLPLLETRSQDSKLVRKPMFPHFPWAWAISVSGPFQAQCFLTEFQFQPCFDAIQWRTFWWGKATLFVEQGIRKNGAGPIFLRTKIGLYTHIIFHADICPPEGNYHNYQSSCTRIRDFWADLCYHLRSILHL